MAGLYGAVLAALGGCEAVKNAGRCGNGEYFLGRADSDGGPDAGPAAGSDSDATRRNVSGPVVSISGWTPPNRSRLEGPIAFGLKNPGCTDMKSTGSTASQCVRVGDQPHFKFDQPLINVGNLFESVLGNRTGLGNQSESARGNRSVSGNLNQSQLPGQEPLRPVTRTNPPTGGTGTGLTVELLAVEFSRDVEVWGLQRDIESVCSVTECLFELCSVI
jgi:hypothetical protein